jgi:flagellar hook-associated protein 2
MSGISVGVGLISGLDINQIVDALVSAQRLATARLARRAERFDQIGEGLKLLETNLLTLKTSLQQLGAKSNFQKLKTANSDTQQLNVTTSAKAAPGTYQFQALHLAATHAVRSTGFANAEQTVGEGTITVARGGRLNRPILLDALNQGEGVRRGTIRVTDRSGASATIDLGSAVTVDDVLAAINDHDGIAVQAAVQEDRIVLTDVSGSTTANLSVVDMAGGRAAADLGIAQSIAASILEGEAVYSVGSAFTLDMINDGNGLQQLQGAPDLKITLSDDTVLNIDLGNATTLADVINVINGHVDNDGKLQATLANGRLTLEDASGGGGTSSFAVENSPGASVVEQLGLNVPADGDTIEGRRLMAGMNSVLLRNLRGGQGIDALGSIQLTDRTGATAAIDLSGAESLDQVLASINAAETDGGVKLQLTAQLDATGTGIEIRDTSGATGENLVIADVGGSTLAAQLGIVVDAAQDAIASGTLHHRYVNQATLLDGYAPHGGAVAPGAFLVVDSAGNEAVVHIGDSVTNIGEVLNRINTVQNVAVRAELNDTGDGIVLIDEAGGESALRVEELGGTTAADLRLLGEGVLGGDDVYRITSRLATVVQVEQGDTLADLVEKLNLDGGLVQATLVNDGTAFNSTRLQLTSTLSGKSGELVFHVDGLSLGLDTVAAAQDAVLRVGTGSTAYTASSGTNTFAGLMGGIDVDVRAVGMTPATVEITRDIGSIKSALQNFVSNYNRLLDTATELTRFNPETNARGVLHGENLVLRLKGRLDSLVNQRFFGPDHEFQSLVDFGIRTDVGGKLVFNDDRFNAAFVKDHQAAADFFTAADSGMSARFTAAVEGFTDPFTGTFKLKDDALKTSVESLDRRIGQLDQLLERRRERLLRQFYNMEAALSALTSQQQAISGISLIRAPKSNSGS